MKIKTDISIIKNTPLISHFGLISSAFTDEILSRLELTQGLYSFFSLDYLTEGIPGDGPDKVNINFDFYLKIIKDLSKTDEDKNITRTERLTQKLSLLREFISAREIKQGGTLNLLRKINEFTNNTESLNGVVNRVFQSGGNTSEFALKLASTLTSYSFSGNRLTTAHALLLAGSLVNRIFEGHRHNTAFVMKLTSALTSQSFKGNRLTSSQALYIANTIVSQVFKEDSYNTANASEMSNTIISQVYRDKKFINSFGYEHPVLHSFNTTQPLNLSIITQKIIRAVNIIEQLKNIQEDKQKAGPTEVNPEVIRELSKISTDTVREIHKVTELYSTMLQGGRLTSAQSFHLANMLMSKVLEGDRFSSAQAYKISNALTGKVLEGDRFSSSQSMRISNVLSLKIIEGDRLSSLHSSQIANALALKILSGDRLTALQSYNITNPLITKLVNDVSYDKTKNTQIINAFLTPHLIYSKLQSRYSQSGTSGQEQNIIWNAPGHTGGSSYRPATVVPRNMEHKIKTGTADRTAERFSSTEVKVLANKVYTLLEDRIAIEKRRMGM